MACLFVLWCVFYAIESRPEINKTENTIDNITRYNRDTITRDITSITRDNRYDRDTTTSISSVASLCGEMRIIQREIRDTVYSTNAYSIQRALRIIQYNNSTEYHRSEYPRSVSILRKSQRRCLIQAQYVILDLISQCRGIIRRLNENMDEYLGDHSIREHSTKYIRYPFERIHREFSENFSDLVMWETKIQEILE